MGIKVGALKSLREEEMEQMTHDLVHRPLAKKPGQAVSTEEKIKELSFIRTAGDIPVLQRIFDSGFFVSEFRTFINEYYDYDRLVAFVMFQKNGKPTEAVDLLSSKEDTQKFFSDLLYDQAAKGQDAGEAYEMLKIYTRLTRVNDHNIPKPWRDVQMTTFKHRIQQDNIETVIRMLYKCDVEFEAVTFLDRLKVRIGSFLKETNEASAGELLRFRAIDYALSSISFRWYEMQEQLQQEKEAEQRRIAESNRKFRAEQEEKAKQAKAEKEEKEKQENETFKKRMESCASAIMRDQALGAQGMQQHYVKDWEQANNTKVVNYILLATDSGLQYVSRIDFLHENDTKGSVNLSKPSELKALDTVGKNYSPRELVERTFKPDVLYLQEYFHEHPRTFESKEVYEAWREVTLNARDVLEQVRQLPPVEVNPEEDPDAQMARLAAYDIEFQSFKRGINVLRHQFNVVRYSTSDVFWNNQLEEFERELFAEYDLTHLTRDALAYARDIDVIVAKIKETERNINTRENQANRDGAYYDLVALLLREGAFAEEVKRFKSGEVIVSLSKEKTRKKTFKRLAKTLGLKRKEFRYLLEVKKTDVSAAYDNVMEPRETE